MAREGGARARLRGGVGRASRRVADRRLLPEGAVAPLRPEDRVALAFLDGVGHHAGDAAGLGAVKDALDDPSGCAPRGSRRRQRALLSARGHKRGGAPLP
jgi:hypothetical protein